MPICPTYWIFLSYRNLCGFYILIIRMTHQWMITHTRIFMKHKLTLKGIKSKRQKVEQEEDGGGSGKIWARGVNEIKTCIKLKELKLKITKMSCFDADRSPVSLSSVTCYNFTHLVYVIAHSPFLSNFSRFCILLTVKREHCKEKLADCH